MVKSGIWSQVWIPAPIIMLFIFKPFSTTFEISISGKKWRLVMTLNPSTSSFIFYLFLSHFSTRLKLQQWWKVTPSYFFYFFKLKINYISKIYNTPCSFTFSLDELRQTLSFTSKLHLPFTKFHFSKTSFLSSTKLESIISFINKFWNFIISSPTWTRQGKYGFKLAMLVVVVVVVSDKMLNVVFVFEI